MEMEEKVLPKKLGGAVTVDVCHGCNGIWFDSHENLQLAPQGTLDLFKLVHSKHNSERRPLADRMSCPRCSSELGLVHDQVRNTRFNYLRCADSHGRFITFFQFLREKNFVHALTPKEINELRAKVQFVNCSNCGAPVELARSMKCDHCDAAISIIDPDRVRKMVEELQGKTEAAKPQKPPELVAMEMQLEKMKIEAMYSQLDSERSYGRRGFGYRNDLVDVGMHAVGALLRGLLG